MKITECTQDSLHTEKANKTDVCHNISMKLKENAIYTYYNIQCGNCKLIQKTGK